MVHIKSTFFTTSHQVPVMTFNNLFSPHSCQEVVLDSMSLGPNIARNAALRENVFMIAICIELRIPLFLVGKPGSSKSLAKSIVQTSMQGAASNSELLRGFKQVSETFSKWCTGCCMCQCNQCHYVMSLFFTLTFPFHRYTCSPTSVASSLLQRV